MSIQRYIKRQVDRVSAFELGTTGEADAVGGTTTQAGGRAHGREGVKTILGEPVQAGTTVIQLAGGDSDQAAVLGIAPFVGG